MSDSVIVYKSSFPEPVPTTTNGSMLMKQFVRSLKNIFDSTSASEHYWEVDPAHTVPVDSIDDWNATNTDKRFFLLLRVKPQVWTAGSRPEDYGLEDPNLQQILIEGIDDDRPTDVAYQEILWVTYAPRGGINETNFREPFTAGTSYGAFTTGRRSMGLNNWDNDSAGGSGAAKRYYGFVNGQFYLAEYRDELREDLLHPYSSLMILFEGGVYTDAANYYPNAWGMGIHAGKIFSGTNNNDGNDFGENGDSPDANHASPGALASPVDGLIGNAFLYYNQKINIRDGDSWLSTGNLELRVYNDSKLVDANGFKRFVPFELNEGATGKLFGYSKYMRQTNLIFQYYTTLKSKDNSSNQAWIGTRKGHTTNEPNYNNHVAFWNKNVVQVTPPVFP